MCPKCNGAGTIKTNPKTYSQLIPKNIIDKISEWQEKAEKWDDIRQHAPNIAETYEKAKKWDNHLCVNNSGNASEYVEYVKRLEEKAQKWDSLWDKCEQVDSTMTPHDMVIWREKAAKWDDSNKEYWEREEKAKRYDEIKKILGD